jgi:hypothetical protein
MFCLSLSSPLTQDPNTQEKTKDPKTQEKNQEQKKKKLFFSDHSEGSL